MDCVTAQFNPFMLGVSALAVITIIFAAGYGISRFGASVDLFIQKFHGEYMLRAAKGIAWFCCVLFLLVFGAVAIKGVRTEPWTLVLVLFPVLQLVFLLMKKYRASFYLTIPELLVLALSWFGYIYSDPDSSRCPPYSIVVGGLGFWLFLAGGGLLFFGIWICNESAKRIKIEMAAHEKH